MLTSPELKDHANIHDNNDDIFRTLIIYYNKKPQICQEILEYLIFDFQITKTEEIKKLLMLEYLNAATKVHCQNIEKMFNVRDIKNKIEADLGKNEKSCLVSNPSNPKI